MEENQNWESDNTDAEDLLPPRVFFCGGAQNSRMPSSPWLSLLSCCYCYCLFYCHCYYSSPRETWASILPDANKWKKLKIPDSQSSQDKPRQENEVEDTSEEQKFPREDPDVWSKVVTVSGSGSLSQEPADKMYPWSPVRSNEHYDSQSRRISCIIVCMPTSPSTLIFESASEVIICTGLASLWISSNTEWGWRGISFSTKPTI